MANYEVIEFDLDDCFDGDSIGDIVTQCDLYLIPNQQVYSLEEWNPFNDYSGVYFEFEQQ